MSTVDIMTMPTVYAQRLNLSLSHIELIASSINSAVVGGSENPYALIPADDLTLARAVMGIAQASVEYDAMFDGEVNNDGGR